MEFSKAEAETLSRIFRWRRDVRHFRTTCLDEDVLDNLRRSMDWAPSVGNARPWRVIRVNDPALRTKIRATFIRCNAEAAIQYTGDRYQQYRQLKLAGLDAAPVQLAVVMPISATMRRCCIGSVGRRTRRPYGRAGDFNVSMELIAPRD